MRVAGLAVSPGHNFFGHHGRPAGSHPIVPVGEIECVAGRGVRGDRFFDYRPDYAGQITFFSLEVHRQLRDALGHRPESAAAYRRNVLVEGADLRELIGREFEVQGVRFAGMAECKPCYWMDQAIGAGAESWLRGRGGLRARILTSGFLRVDADAAGLLLAGGRSTRMGCDKAGLEWRGRPLVRHQAETLFNSGAWPVACAQRAGQRLELPGCRRIEDAKDGDGPVAAVAQAFSELGAEVLLVLAVDMPKISPEFLAELAQLARGEGISVLPHSARGLEPLAAAWHRSAIPSLCAVAARGGAFCDVAAALALRGALRFRELTLAENDLFLNLNAPSDLARNRSGDHFP